jgi:OmcA/MtrC family decaheme c-type cytochrome
MANCVTCHEGKLDTVLADANFTVATCKSCHPMTGAKAAVAKEGDTPAWDTTKLALKTILPEALHGKLDLATTDCTMCHKEGGVAPTFKKIHTGYDKAIYNAAGIKYSDAISVTIQSAALTGNKLNIKFKAGKTADVTDIDITKTMTPTVLVGLYGWNTKDFIIGPHERLIDDNKDGKFDSKDGRNLEAEVGAEHPRIKTIAAKDGAWEVEADLTAWADLLKNGTVKRVEVGVLSQAINADKVEVAINAATRTFDLKTNKFDDKAFSPIVAADKCESCHAALATTFHEPSYGGNVTACRMCHITKAGGSHLEMQSRSIDSYVHAIHSGQVFDVAAIDFKDPVQALKYEEHIAMPYPTHANTNCESCHLAGTYNAPSQSKSLPGLLSASAKNESWGRNIGVVPSQHFDQGGYIEPAGEKPLDTLMKKINDVMALFK